jgi:hypothetical protein
MPRGRRSRFLPTIFVMFWSLLLAAELSAQTSAPAGCLIPNWTRAVLKTPLVPDHAEPGSPAFTLTVNGTGFGNGQQVFWNSVGLVTPGGNWSQTAGTVPASLLAQAGTAAVTVQNSSLPSLPQYFYIAAAHKIGSASWIRTDYSAGSWPERQLVADLNNDGKLDMITLDSINNAVVVRLGKGNGTFASPQSFSTGSQPSGLAVADFNADYNLDIVTANYSGGGPGTVSVLLGNGNGTLGSHTDFAVGQGPIAVAAADFECDGFPDLAVANSVESTVTLLHNTSSGPFITYATTATGPDPVALTVGDFNRDGALDVAVTNVGPFSGNTVSILFGDAQGNFFPKIDYVTDSGPQSVVAADLNHDGILDLVTANGCGHSSTCGRPGSVSVLLGNSNGTFQNTVNYNAGNYPFSVVAGNFRAVDALDLAVTDLDSGQIFVLLGKGDGTFPSSFLIPTNGRPVGLAMGDFNNDGRPDLIGGGTSPAMATVMLQK